MIEDALELILTVAVYGACFGFGLWLAVALTLRLLEIVL